MAKKKKKTLSSDVEKWTGHFSTYDKLFKKWENRCDEIIKRYTDERGSARTNQSSKFNILWSNVQTLSAATFAKLPKPDVSRRFKDNDPVGRVASLILERALDYEIQHYSDYRLSLKSCVLDRFLGGRGTAWVRYEPHFMALEQDVPVNGLQVTEDVDEPGEQIDYECAPIDYVHWRDFGHTSARTWDEVTAVWRRVYMSRAALVERFGEELGNRIPLDAVPEEYRDKEPSSVGSDLFRGCIYEIWDKETKRVLWLSKSLGEVLDEVDDPLGLEEFFPCPKPLYATITNESLVPVPDYTLYQDQCRLLDVCSNRIDQLTRALQVKGVYNAAEPILGRLFTEGDNTQLYPVKNWQAFSEKQGLTGAIQLVDLAPIAAALKETYLAMDQVKNQVYEITGISDIIRGQGDAGETATAQEIKGQFASLRLKSYQEQVGEFAAQAIQLKAQIICTKYTPETILQISAADQLSQQDKQLIPEAMKLLIGDRSIFGPDGVPAFPDADSENPLRSFRIEIESDSLVYLDEQADRQARMQFIDVNAKFMGQAIATLQNAGPAAPALVPLTMEIWKFGVRGFKVGKSIEGAFDEASEKVRTLLEQALKAPKPPDPKVQAAQMGLEKTKMEMQGEMQLAPVRAQTEQVKAQAETVKAQASMVTAATDLQEAQLRASNPQAFQAPQRPQ